MSPNTEIIEKHLEKFIDDFSHLAKHKNISFEQLERDRDLYWAIERGLFLVIQNLVDMFAHIVAYDFNDNWDYYSEIAEILHKYEVINDEQKEMLINIIGFRNRLSHEYLSLDKNTIVGILQNRLQDLKQLAEIIRNYCNLK